MQIELPSPFTCVLANVKGHLEEGGITITNLDLLQTCLLRKSYNVKNIEPVYDSSGFTGFVLIEFGSCNESCYSALKLHARFQSEGRGRCAWLAADDDMQPCLWVMDDSDVHIFRETKVTTSVNYKVKSEAYAVINRENDGVYESIINYLSEMYPTSIECAKPYSCGLRYNPKETVEVETLGLWETSIHTSLVNMGYDIRDVNALCNENGFEGIFLICFGDSNEACFSAFKLQSHCEVEESSVFGAAVSASDVIPYVWVTQSKDHSLFNRPMRAVYVSAELVSDARFAGKQESTTAVKGLTISKVKQTLI